jgi:hypothetical protein
MWLAAVLILGQVIVPKSASPDIVNSTQVREDVEAGRKAYAAYQARELREARERRLRFDREHMRENRLVLSLISNARARYERVRTPGALKDSRLAARWASARARRTMDRIDRWRNRSKVLPDYDALLLMLTDQYPVALDAALHGDEKELTALRASFDTRESAVRTWLAEAASHVDEEEEEE